MIYLNKEALNKINKITKDNVYILADFDRTITLGSSNTSWSILAKSDMVPKEYVIERQKLYDIYRPIEINEQLPYETKNKLMIEWWTKHIELFIKYELKEEVVNYAAKNLRVMAFRDGAEEFLKDMYEKNIPIIIISAGIGNFIEQFLIKNNCYYQNIHIVSNFIKFADGKAVGMADNIIHSLNKNEVALSNSIKDLLINRPNIVLLGDGLADTLMVSKEKGEKALKIGFLEENVKENLEIYRKSFDIVCTDNTSFKELKRKLVKKL